MSSSDRRSGSSGRSKKRETVFISTSQRDRARTSGRAAGASPGKGRQPARVVGHKPEGLSASRRRADELRSAREKRLSAQRIASRLRIGALIAAVVIVIAGCVALYTSSLLPVDKVEVVGNRHITRQAVLALAKVPDNATLIRFPGDAVAKRVSASPWVSSVAVSRVFPSGMRIRITERAPVAIVDAVETVWLVDSSGMVIAKPTTETSETIPVIRDVPGLDPKPGRRTTSEPLLNAVKILTGMDRRLIGTVRSVSAPSVDGAVLVRSDHLEIVVGEAVDLETKSRLALQILSDQKGKVVSIDVRVVDRPTWRGIKK